MYLFPQNTLSLQTSKLQIMKRLVFFLTLAALVFMAHVDFSVAPSDRHNNT